MATDDEIARRLQAQVDAEKPMTVEFTEPGPFELPKCGKASVLLMKGDYFVLELQTEEHSQRLFVPISARALDELKACVDVMQRQYGVGKPRN